MKTSIAIIYNNRNRTHNNYCHCAFLFYASTIESLIRRRKINVTIALFDRFDGRALNTLAKLVSVLFYYI